MNAPRKVRVLIVEDSPVTQQLLDHIVAGDDRLEVAAILATAEEALRLMPRLRPDVVSLDIRLPGMNGLEATRRIMAECPTPIVVVSANVDDAALNISMNALRAGALTVVEKPVGLDRSDYDRLARHLCTQLVIMSQVKVVRQRLDRHITTPSTITPSTGANLPYLPPAANHTYAFLGIAASTGGPSALVSLLNALPQDFSLPIAVVQHMDATFLDGFAAWLNSVTRLPVSITGPHDAPQSGHVYLAPGHAHLKVHAGGFQLSEGCHENNQKPAADVLFRSLAETFGNRAIGVLLTGMGEDGARGLLAMREAGGFTIAEDSSTAVIYGMPGTAVRLGAAIEELPLPAIPHRLVTLAGSKPRRKG